MLLLYYTLQRTADFWFWMQHRGSTGIPCDEIGGTVKRLVARARLQLTTEAIDTPEKIYKWYKENIYGITLFFESKAAVESHCISIQLEERYARCTTIPGTRIHHSFIPRSLTSLKWREFHLMRGFHMLEFCHYMTSDLSAFMTITGT